MLQEKTGGLTERKPQCNETKLEKRSDSAIRWVSYWKADITIVR